MSKEKSVNQHILLPRQKGVVRSIVNVKKC